MLLSNRIPEPLVLLLLGALSGPLLVHADGSDGCGNSVAYSTDQQTTLNITSNGDNRTYMYWLPPNYSADTPSPLIISMHGAGGTSENQADLDALTDSEFNTDHILVYPQSTETNGEILWEVSPEVNVDDVSYLLSVLDQVKSDFCIEQTRIYATGMSQGGGMVNMLACDANASKLFAAYAPVSGSYYYDEDSNGDCADPDTVDLTCDGAQNQTAIMAFHGGSDDVIWYDGGTRRGGCLPSIEHWANLWAERNGIDSDDNKTESFGSDDAEKYVYGTNGLTTLVYDGDKVEHAWPLDYNNPDDNSSGPSASFNASSMIMDFFALYSLPEPSPTSSPTPAPTETNPDNGNAAGHPVPPSLAGASGLFLLILSLL